MVYRGDRPLKRRKWRNWIIAAVIVLGAGAAVGFYLRPKAQPNKSDQTVVPATISAKVSFPVYYPDPKKLPAGYSLDRSSFSTPVKNGVTYKVLYSGGKKLVFSIQTKPSDNQIQTFNSNYIPLRIDYQTPVGQAEIGAYHGQTLVSLPVTNGPWIVITAPTDINQGQLKTILSSIRR